MSNAAARAWLKPVLKPVRPVFREVLLMSFFVNILALAVPIFVQQVYDRVVAHAGMSTLRGLVIGMIFVLIFDFVLRQSRARILQTVALRIDVVVGEALFNKFMALPLTLLESKPANYWQSLFRDADTVRNTLSGSTALLIVDLPFAVLFLVVILLVAMPVAWVLLVILPLYMFLAWRSGSAMATANKAERESGMSRDSLVAEMIGGRTTIKALALGRAMRPLWETKHAENIEQSVSRGAKTDAYSNLGQSLTLVTSIAMTSVGAIAIVGQSLTMGALIAANMLSGRLLGPLNQLVGQWRTYNSFRQSVERLGEVFNTEGERQESDVKLNRPKGEIVCEALTFSYAKNLPPICDNISITIKAGGIHALVGRNGSGKTTLLKMIQGLYMPTSGRVLLDGADISQFTREELARWMGYVPQECVLFAGTVRDNIIHRFPDAKDDDILRAATASGAHQFIIDLPDGYGSDIGEAGRRLSGGQRQRIAIARALLGDPAVLLLDEPSSSLDRQAEQELRQTLVQIAKERTVVVVTHSPILLAACDDLVALDKGKVALAGPSKEILPRLFGAGPKPQAAAAAGPTAAPQPAVQPQPAAAPVRPPAAPAPGPAMPAAAMVPPGPAPRPAAAAPQAPRPVPRPIAPPAPELPAQPVPPARPAAAPAPRPPAPPQALRPPAMPAPAPAAAAQAPAPQARAPRSEAPRLAPGAMPARNPAVLETHASGTFKGPNTPAPPPTSSGMFRLQGTDDDPYADAIKAVSMPKRG